MNRSDRQTRAQGQPEKPELIRGVFYTFEGPAGERAVRHEYAYMAARATIFDQELVNFANRRDAELKAKRSSTAGRGR